MEATDLLVLGKKCLVPTDKCFWKAPEDIKSQGVKTRSRTKKERVVTNREHNHYFEKGMDFRYGDIYYERIRSVLYCLILFLMLRFIVNNGNILTDDRDGRKYLERKYKELQFLVIKMYLLIIILQQHYLFFWPLLLIFATFVFHLPKFNATQ